MQVGDLVKFRSHIGLIISKDEWSTLVCWADGETEDIANYARLTVEVISASR